MQASTLIYCSNSLYVPFGHKRQYDWFSEPELGLYVPAIHFLHSELPGESLYVPGGHNLHEVALLPPVLSL